MQRIIQNNLPLEGENQYKRQQKSNGGNAVKLLDEGAFKILRTLFSCNKIPGQHTTCERNDHEQHHRQNQRIPWHGHIGNTQQELHNGDKCHKDNEVIGRHLHHRVCRVTLG